MGIALCTLCTPLCTLCALIKKKYKGNHAVGRSDLINRDAMTHLKRCEWCVFRKFVRFYKALYIKQELVPHNTRCI